MAKDPEQARDRLVERINDGERGGSDDDRDTLLAFADALALQPHETGAYRQLKLLRHCTRMAEEVGGLARSLHTRDAAEDIVRWIHDTYDNPETNKDYRVALKGFGRRVADEGVDDDPTEPPASMAWISSRTPRNYNPEPDPGDMLDWSDDIVGMIEATHSTRDAALLALQFDAGLRGGELYDLAVGSISDSEHSLKVFVDGKRGQRSVDLIPSIPHVNRWLADHPEPNDPEAPLWCTFSGGEVSQIGYRRYLQVFKENARRAGVSKTASPTNFRTSNASWLARQGANAALLEDRQGRKRGSEQVARYVARFGDEAETQYALLHGVDIEDDEPEEIGPLTCPRCERQTPREKPLCVWCSQALSPDAADEVAEQDQAVTRAAARASGDRAEALADLKAVLDDHPELRRGVD
jgi:site-specific recombinase XerD